MYCVEPNLEMRQAAVGYLGTIPGFVSVDGRAEGTGLPAQSVDLVIAGQAFHWFNRELAKKEFRRLLLPGGGCMLVWNARLLNSSSFAVAYEETVLRYACDYNDVRHRGITDDRSEELECFFSPHKMTATKVGRVVQRFDLASLRGRMLSSSYMPKATDPVWEAVTADIALLFDRHNVDGLVTIEYDTWAYHGRLD